MSKTPSKGKPVLYAVQVGFRAPDGESTVLGVWRGFAGTVNEAKTRAYDAQWDSRLDATSCSPEYEVLYRGAPLYVTSQAWPHRFRNGVESITRWVIDLETNRLVAAMEACDAGWTPLNPVAAEHLAGALLDSRVLDVPTTTPPLALRSLEWMEVWPSWADQNLQVQLAPPSSPTVNPTQERDILAKAIAEAAVTAGIIKGDQALTGPQLLLLLQDLTALATQPAPVQVVIEARNNWIHRIVSDRPIEVVVLDFDVDGYDPEQKTELNGEEVAPSAFATQIDVERVQAADALLRSTWADQTPVPGTPG